MIRIYHLNPQKYIDIAVNVFLLKIFIYVTCKLNIYFLKIEET